MKWNERIQEYKIRRIQEYKNTRIQKELARIPLPGDWDYYRVNHPIKHKYGGNKT